jgi:hypothetical protein
MQKYVNELDKRKYWGCNWATLFLGEINTGTWPCRCGISDLRKKNMIMSPAGLSSRLTALAKSSSSCKIQTCLLVREDASHHQTCNHLKIILKLVVCILLRLLGQVQGRQKPRTWPSTRNRMQTSNFKIINASQAYSIQKAMYIFPLEDGHKAETCSGYWIKYSNQCCVRRKPWTWSKDNLKKNYNLVTGPRWVRAYHRLADWPSVIK